MFRSSNNHAPSTTKTSGSSSSSVLFNILRGPTKTTPRRSRSSETATTADSAIERVLSVNHNHKHTHSHTHTAKPGQDDLEYLTDVLRQAETLQQMVNDGLIVIHDGKGHKTPRRAKSDDGASVKSIRSSDTRRNRSNATAA